MSFRTIVFILAASILNTACGSADPNVNNVNGNRLANNSNGFKPLDANNMPPGLSASPVAPSANTTPGIPPANQVVNTTKGTTPTPGIPDPKAASKPARPGATPTPGIPDPANVRRVPTGTAPPPPPPSDSPTVRTKKPRVGMQR